MNREQAEKEFKDARQQASAALTASQGAAAKLAKTVQKANAQQQSNGGKQ